MQRCCGREQALQVLREMSPDSSRVSYHEWLGGREFLPKIYRTMLALCDGLVFYDDRGIRPTFDRASDGW